MNIYNQLFKIIFRPFRLYFRNYITCILVFLCGALFSQNENSKWYFGQNAGLDFFTSPPSILTNGALSTNEGCASISDATGSLLFYTDGMTVYNQTHAIMANGTGLMGNVSTTQSAIIVKQPGNNNIYYIFTQAAFAGTNGLRYSEVDMNLAAGMGSVTVKNYMLYVPSCEKITAVRHCNGIDVWIITHDWNSANFRTYLITSAGINLTPVISTSGIIINDALFLRTIGHMKISPDGKKLGLAINDDTNPAPYEIHDFDAATGIVSNPITLGNFLLNYGCEFSPDGTKFYGVADYSCLFQWDLCAGSTAAIIASQYSVSTGLTANGSLQLGPDGKIYLCKSFSSFLDVINTPNAAGLLCNYVSSGVSLSPGICRLGLPNFINNPPPKIQLPLFTFTVNCQNVSFNSPAVIQSTFASGCTVQSASVISRLWSFGDPSMSNNSSSLINPSHYYSNAGTYTVSLILYSACSSDTIKLPVTITSVSSLSITGTYSICSGEKRIYTASGASNYTWSTGANTNTVFLSPTVTTTFSVAAASTNSCSNSKAFTITVSKCAGIHQTEANETTVKIFPNPASTHLTLETESFITLKWINPLGEVIFEAPFQSGTHNIDLSGFSNGIYILQSTGKNGTQTMRLLKLE